KSSCIDTSQLLDDPNMPELEDITYSNNEDDIGAEADFNNLETSITVSPILITRVHKDHPVIQIINDLSSAIQTSSMTGVAKDQRGATSIQDAKSLGLSDLPYGKRVIGTKWVFRNKKDKRGIVVRNKSRLVAQGHTQKEGIDYEEVFALVVKIEAIRLFLAYASFMGFMVYQMDVKSAFMNKKDKRGIVVRNKSRLVAQGHTQKEGIDYEEVFALVVKIEAIRLFLAYASFMGFMVYQMDVKSAFMYGTNKEEIYVDDIIFGSTINDLCKAFEKLMKDKFQMSSIRELTFFLGLQVKQKKDGIFISQDKYATEILRKFRITDRKSASTPIDTKKPLLKDPDVKRIFRYLKGKPHLGLQYPKDSPFDLVAYSDTDYAGASLDRKSTTEGFQFLGCGLISWQCKKQIVMATSSTEAEYVATASCCGKVLWIQNQLLDYGSIKYALTVNPNIYVSCIKFFWNSVAVKKVNDVTQLQALVDKKKVIITKASIRDALRLDDAEGKGFFRVETPIFKGMIVEQQVANEGDAEVNVDDVPAVGIAVEGVVSAANDKVHTAVKEPSIPSPIPPTPPPQPSQDQPLTSQVHLTPPHLPQAQPQLLQHQPQPVENLEQDKIAQALEITKLKSRVKKLERRNKASKLKRLKKVGTTQRIETSDDTVMDNVSKQWRMIADMDADVDVVLEDAKEVVVEKSADVDESADVQGRQSKSQAQIYQINLEHADKESVMDSKPMTMQEVVEIANDLMDQTNQQQPLKKQNVARAYTTGPGEKKVYGGSKPLCPKCNYHRDGAAGAIQKVVTCFECGVQGHYRRNYPKLKNKNQDNQAGNGNAQVRAYAVRNTGKNPDANVITVGTILVRELNAVDIKLLSAAVANKIEA
nr:hypothetical protein [Tanacetum cinerariifolium]